MDIVFSASIIASFIAGMVALFAPCCITVLLPTYLASAFRQKNNALKMTFVFFTGIAAILIPIGLGAAALAQLFRNFHQEMYIIGGIFMLVLAVMAVLGKKLSIIPMKKVPAQTSSKTGHYKSAFLLGLFSGGATSCCAPVLAGAVTLAAISGAFWKALIVIFAYVFGMTFPLFVAAYFYDRFHLENSRLIKGKILEFKLGEKSFYVHSTNLFAGFIFLAMGVILLVLAFSGNMFWAPSFQTAVGSALNQWSQNALSVLVKIPDIAWGIIIIGFFLFLALRAYKKKEKIN